MFRMRKHLTSCRFFEWEVGSKSPLLLKASPEVALSFLDSCGKVSYIWLIHFGWFGGGSVQHRVFEFWRRCKFSGLHFDFPIWWDDLSPKHVRHYIPLKKHQTQKSLQHPSLPSFGWIQTIRVYIYIIYIYCIIFYKHIVSMSYILHV